MSTPKKILLLSSVILFLSYLVYGALFLDLPCINPDENWQIARTRHFIQFHQVGDPLFKKEVSPFLAVFFNATPINHYIGILKFGAYSASFLLLPLDENQAVHFTSFLLSLLLAISVYLLGREFKLSRFCSLLSVIVLIITPEFLTQIHSSRSEIALSLLYVFYVILLFRTFRIKSETRQIIYLFVIGLTSWIPAIALHPTALFIPPSLGIIYLVLKRKSIFTIKTLFLGISFLPGFLLYLYIYLSVGTQANALGGGNYFDVQGPPVLEEPFYLFLLKTPLLFYNNFFSLNFLSKPLSFAWFLFSLYGIYIIYKDKLYLLQFFPFLLTAVTSALVITFFFSGSYGAYNIIIFPFLAVVIAFFINNFIERKQAPQSRSVYIAAVFALFFFSNFYGLQAHALYHSEYKKLQAKVREIIPPGVAILGSPLYYTAFEHQPFYHIVWLEPAAGIPGQSFQEGVSALNVQYLIVDDIFFAKVAAVNRSSEWKDSLMVYLNEECTLLNTLKTYYYVPRIGKPESFPESWRYEGMKKKFLQKVCIYKVNSPE